MRYSGLWATAGVCFLGIIWAIFQSHTDLSGTNGWERGQFSLAEANKEVIQDLESSQPATPTPATSTSEISNSNNPALQEMMRERAKTIDWAFGDWWDAHTDSAETVKTWYAPDACIYYFSNDPLTSQEFLARLNTSAKMWSTLSFSIKRQPLADGRQFIKAYATYRGTDHTTPRWITVQLVWHKYGEYWRIERERWQVETTGPLRLTLAPSQYHTFPQDEDKSAFAKRVTSTPIEERNALLERYELWKNTHHGPVEPYIALYAAEAKIHETGSILLTRERLSGLANSTRTSGQYDQVSDALPPQVAVRGENAEIRVQNRYGNSGDGNYSYGRRRLVWRKQSGEWYITEDWFPDTYSYSPPTQ